MPVYLLKNIAVMLAFSEWPTLKKEMRNYEKYKSDLIHEFLARLKTVITRTHHRCKDACEKHVYSLKPASLRSGLPWIYLDY